MMMMFPQTPLTLIHITFSTHKITCSVGARIAIQAICFLVVQHRNKTQEIMAITTTLNEFSPLYKTVF